MALQSLEKTYNRFGTLILSKETNFYYVVHRGRPRIACKTCSPLVITKGVNCQENKAVDTLS